MSGWIIAVAVPVATLNAPAKESLAALVLGAGGAILVGILGSLLVGRRLSQAMATLSSAALALGHGATVALPAVRIREVDGVARSLKKAAEIRDQAEQDARVASERLRAIVETAVDAFVVIDERGTIQSFNRAAERLFGYTSEEAVGENVRLLMPEPDRSAHDRYIGNYRRTGERKIIGIGREVEGRRKDGSTFPLELSIAEWTDGRQRFFTGIMRDITARRQAEEALRAAKAEAERANLSKSKFLASASHDLRQPMQSLLLFMGALRDRLHDHPASRLLDVMQQALDAQAALLEGLIDVSRLDAGLVVPHAIEFPLGALLTRLGQEYGARANAKGLKLRVVSTAACVQSDPALVERILRNLIENAIRYTERGGIVVGCRRRGKTMNLEVVDTGIGIPAEEQDEIWQEFHQVGNPERDRTKGLGLGLAVVRRLGRLLGHVVGVRSRLGQGSAFFITLPLAARMWERSSAERAVTSGGQRQAANESSRSLIVVIDDEALIREGFKAMLEGWGYVVLTAGSAEEAVDIVSQHGARPDLIVADYRLRHGLTGVQAIEDLRASCGFAIPALVVTGDTAAERLTEVTQAGHALLHKPVAAAELHESVLRLLKTA